MSKTRVVITGLGATTPLGGDVSSTWEGLLAGRSGARRLTDEWVQNLAVQIAAPAAVEPTEVLERVKARRLDRNAQFAVVAAREAWATPAWRTPDWTRSDSGWRSPPASVACTPRWPTTTP